MSLHRDGTFSDANTYLPNTMLPWDGHTVVDLEDSSSFLLEPPNPVSHNIIPSTVKHTMSCHLKTQPPKITIPERYKWVILQGGWSLIPCDISDKITSNQSTPPVPILEDQDECVQGTCWWGDDEDQDFLAEDFADEKFFLEEVNLRIEAHEDTLQENLAFDE